MGGSATKLGRGITVTVWRMVSLVGGAERMTVTVWAGGGARVTVMVSPGMVIVMADVDAGHGQQAWSWF